jgi:branched-chain amino acid transport system ATP-binding protein
MRVIMGLSHRVLVLHHGETIAMGKPEVVSKDPAVLTAYLGERHGQPANQ